MMVVPRSLCLLCQQGPRRYAKQGLVGHVRTAITHGTRCRQFSSNNGGNPTDFLRNGTLELVIGSALLVALLADPILQWQQRRAKEDVMNQLRNDVLPNRAELEELDEWLNMPSKFQCTVRKVPPNWDGTKVLKFVREGDTVEVLQEMVGPDKMYNLCRTLNDDTKPLSVGWFPTMYLEKKK